MVMVQLFPATYQGSALYNSMYPAPTLRSQPLPGVTFSSVQPTSNVQPHHLTFAPLMRQLVPPAGPLSNYRRVEGPLFSLEKMKASI